MLTIRAKQLDAFSKSGFDRFVTSEQQRLSADAKASSGSLIPDEAWVREGIESGKPYGMYSESDHARFNDLRLSEGPDFPTPDDLAVLEQEDLWGWQKLDELEGRLALTIKGHTDE